MSDIKPASFEMVMRPAELLAAVRDIAGQAVIAVDTESNSRHHYPEQLCLIQISTAYRTYIIDTITLKDMAPLKTVLENPGIRKVIHGADYDIRCFDRHYGFRVHNLLDTSVAARFAGITEFGLAALIKNLLGLPIVKSERLQQSDWGRRPLSAEALQYAAADVHDLIALGDILQQRIRELSREDWVAEECLRLEEVRYSAPDLETAFLSIKGAQDLKPRELAVLHSLALFREDEAVRRGRPPFFVIPDFALITLAANPGVNLSNVSGLGPYALQHFGPGLQNALKQGQAALPYKRPPSNNERLNREQSTLLACLKVWRTGEGTALSIDPPLLWPTPSLERLAREPRSFSTEIASPLIRTWQRKRFGSSLKLYLEANS